MLDEWGDQESASSESARKLEQETPKKTRAVLPRKEPLFSVELLEDNVTKNRGELTALAASNGVLLFGTDKGWALRQDFSTGETTEMDVSIPRWGDQFIHKVFLDAGGVNGLISLESSAGGGETLYLHSQLKKPRILSKLKGAVVNAAAWYESDEAEVPTKEVIIGTMGGQLFELVIDQKDKKEKSLKLVFDLKEEREPICGVQIFSETQSSTKKLAVVVVTQSKMCLFYGRDSIQTVFSNYNDKTPTVATLPGGSSISEIRASPKNLYLDKKLFVWVTESSIYSGEIDFSMDEEGAAVNSDSIFGLTQRSSQGRRIVSSSLSDFHILLLHENCISVTNQVSDQVIEELPLEDSRLHGGFSGLCGLTRDDSEGVIYGFSKGSLYEVSSPDEARDMWQTFMDHEMFSGAMETSKNEAQRSEVFLAQANAAFSEKEYESAAVYSAKAEGAISFEDSALKFINVGAQDALRLFLFLTLESRAPNEVTQSVMICTWILELFLSKINRLDVEMKLSGPLKRPALDGSDPLLEYESTVAELEEFLTERKDFLDEKTAVRMLASYGRVEELIHFAEVKGNHEIVIQQLLKANSGNRVFEFLRTSSDSVELQYKYGPQLVKASVKAAVDLWIWLGDRISPQKLIPSLLEAAQVTNSTANGVLEAIRYLTFCIQSLRVKDAAVHNLLLSLYAKQEEESLLIAFLTNPPFPEDSGSAFLNSQFHYDPKYALRICLQNGRLRSCVAVYGRVKMHREAVALALKIDLDLAKAEANRAEDDLELKKTLWLMIARHVIQKESQEEGIKQAISLIRDTQNLVKIEDILPLFPEFTLIDHVKEAVCSALEEYSSQIEELKGEMDDVTKGSDKIRQEMVALSQRFVLLGNQQPCDLCGTALMVERTAEMKAAPFYVFPCHHGFHSSCLVAHCIQNSSAEIAIQIESLQKSMRKTLEDSTQAHGSQREAALKPLKAQFETLQSQLDESISSECPFCGSLMIESVTASFVKEDEEALEFWSIAV